MRMCVCVPLMALLLSPLTTASTAKRTAWVVESPAFAAAVRSSLSTSWELKDCSANGAGCAVSLPDAEVVIGLYQRVFETKLAANEELRVFAWEDEEVELP